MISYNKKLDSAKFFRKKIQKIHKNFIVAKLLFICEKNFYDQIPTDLIYLNIYYTVVKALLLIKTLQFINC